MRETVAKAFAGSIESVTQEFRKVLAECRSDAIVPQDLEPNVLVNYLPCAFYASHVWKTNEPSHLPKGSLGFWNNRVADKNEVIRLTLTEAHVKPRTKRGPQEDEQGVFSLLITLAPPEPGATEQQHEVVECHFPGKN
jgi:hypothetical protein